jgi:hypothetical protein
MREILDRRAAETLGSVGLLVGLGMLVVGFAEETVTLAIPGMVLFFSGLLHGMR